MKRRDFFKIAVAATGITLVPIKVFPEFSEEPALSLWDTLRLNGFEWKLRYPGMRFRGGLEPGPWFLKHPLLGKVRSAEWDVTGEHREDNDEWQDHETWFYHNTGQLHYWCFHEHRKYDYTLYLPYKKFPVLRIEFNTPADFQKEWDRVKKIII